MPLLSPLLSGRGESWILSAAALAAAGISTEAQAYSISIPTYSASESNAGEIPDHVLPSPLRTLGIDIFSTGTEPLFPIAAPNETVGVSGTPSSLRMDELPNLAASINSQTAKASTPTSGEPAQAQMAVSPSSIFVVDGRRYKLFAKRDADGKPTNSFTFELATEDAGGAQPGNQRTPLVTDGEIVFGPQGTVVRAQINIQNPINNLPSFVHVYQDTQVGPDGPRSKLQTVIVTATPLSAEDQTQVGSQINNLGIASIGQYASAIQDVTRGPTPPERRRRRAPLPFRILKGFFVTSVNIVTAPIRIPINAITRRHRKPIVIPTTVQADAQQQYWVTTDNINPLLNRSPSQPLQLSATNMPINSVTVSSQYRHTVRGTNIGNWDATDNPFLVNTAQPLTPTNAVYTITDSRSILLMPDVPLSYDATIRSPSVSALPYTLVVNGETQDTQGKPSLAATRSEIDKQVQSFTRNWLGTNPALPTFDAAPEHSNSSHDVADPNAGTDDAAAAAESARAANTLDENRAESATLADPSAIVAGSPAANTNNTQCPHKRRRGLSWVFHKVGRLFHGEKCETPTAPAQERPGTPEQPQQQYVALAGSNGTNPKTRRTHGTRRSDLARQGSNDAECETIVVSDLAGVRARIVNAHRARKAALVASGSSGMHLAKLKSSVANVGSYIWSNKGNIASSMVAGSATGIAMKTLFVAAGIGLTNPVGAAAVAGAVAGVAGSLACNTYKAVKANGFTRAAMREAARATFNRKNLLMAATLGGIFGAAASYLTAPAHAATAAPHGAVPDTSALHTQAAQAVTAAPVDPSQQLQTLLASSDLSSANNHILQNAQQAAVDGIRTSQDVARLGELVQNLHQQGNDVLASKINETLTQAIADNHITSRMAEVVTRQNDWLRNLATASLQKLAA